jgi:hypothetical protein
VEDDRLITHDSIPRLPEHGRTSSEIQQFAIKPLAVDQEVIEPESAAGKAPLDSEKKKSLIIINQQLLPDAVPLLPK